MRVNSVSGRFRARVEHGLPVVRPVPGKLAYQGPAHSPGSSVVCRDYHLLSLPTSKVATTTRRISRGHRMRVLYRQFRCQSDHSYLYSFGTLVAVPIAVLSCD